MDKQNTTNSGTESIIIKNEQLSTDGTNATILATDFNFHALDSHYTSEFNVGNRQLYFFRNYFISDQLIKNDYNCNIFAKVSRTSRHLPQTH